MSNIDKYETRKKMVYDFMCDDMYVPMKIKELCIVLGVRKEDRPQLEQILLDMQAEGRIHSQSAGNTQSRKLKRQSAYSQRIKGDLALLLWRESLMIFLSLQSM